jgi:hypothetical protein
LTTSGRSARGNLDRSRSTSRATSTSSRSRNILPIWADLPEPAVFDIYPLEEITAEKLRCVMQRSQCRDLYDLYRLTEDAGMDLDELRPLSTRRLRRSISILAPSRRSSRNGSSGTGEPGSTRFLATSPSHHHSAKSNESSGDTFAALAT